jgi:hypothetical protein
MKATIVHDEHGRIISVSKAVDLKKAGSKFIKVGMVPGPSQRVLEVELDREHEKLPLREYHAKYRVDVAGLKLVKKDH